MATSKPKRRNLVALLMVAAVLAMAAGTHSARAAYNGDNRDEPHKAAITPTEPATLQSLQEKAKSEPDLKSKSDRDNCAPNDNLCSAVAKSDNTPSQDLQLKIRLDAQKTSAISLGARGGLAWRTKQIMEELNKSAPALDKTYNFRRLLIKAPSNMFIEPPIVSEALNNFLVTPAGDEAAVADAIYNISRQARIVAGPRHWRQYLEREWKNDLAPPPDILLPENDIERAAWRKWTKVGWEEGYKQADEIFQADLDRLVADFEGMVRYRVLLTQNKISAPYATLVDRGISGNDVETMVGDRPMKVTTEMRIGDRAIRITQPATLRPDKASQEWQPPMETAQ